MTACRGAAPPLGSAADSGVFRHSDLSLIINQALLFCSAARSAFNPICHRGQTLAVRSGGLVGGSKRAIQTFLSPGDHRSLELLELIIPGRWWRAGRRRVERRNLLLTFGFSYGFRRKCNNFWGFQAPNSPISGRVRPIHVGFTH